MAPMETNLDYSLLLKEARVLQPAAGLPTMRIALLGDCALQQFLPLLRALFYRGNFSAEFHEGGFDGIEFEALNPQSALYRFEPDVIVLLNAVQSLRDKYYLRPGDASDIRQRDALAYDAGMGFHSTSIHRRRSFNRTSSRRSNASTATTI